MPFDMMTFPTHLHGIISTISPLDVFDILIVAAILYKVYEMLQETRAITLVKGLIVLLTVAVICNWLNLHVISWLLQKAISLLFVALPIVFQPELRRALEHLGQGKILGKSVFLDDKEAQNVVDELVKASKTLSATKTGALIVIEREMKLNDISSTG
ncbi:MAG: TIGR00159 family protein, partial [Selenomonadaceae bacterium]|nr:TIGR00159 family protein [Selenomonadaceae bacterium]